MRKVIRYYLLRNDLAQFRWGNSSSIMVDKELRKVQHHFQVTDEKLKFYDIKDIFMFFLFNTIPPIKMNEIATDTYAKFLHIICDRFAHES